MLPQLARDLDWVNAGGLPPSSLIAGAMDGTVMGTAERYSKLVARLAAERLRLHVSKMMRVGWLAAADETCPRKRVTATLHLGLREHPSWMMRKPMGPFREIAGARRT